MPLQATSGAASYDAFGGGVPVVPNYIEEVFSTYLYKGNSLTQTITNGIDLSTKGGLVWIKSRDTTFDHMVFDTSRGASKYLNTNNTTAQSTNIYQLSSFDTNGFTLGDGNFTNNSAYNYASWTFRKQPKFFDIVTYTGNGTAGRAISHNLGSTPGCVITKSLSIDAGWPVYHRSTGDNKSLFLNGTDAVFSNTDRIRSVTSTTFTVGTSDQCNQNGTTYVAYLFAHDAGGFGLTGTDNVISCGSYAGNNSISGPTITLGYEPQWVMIKRSSGGVGDWVLMDNMRGMAVTGNSQYLRPNSSGAEDGFENFISPTATGFQINSNDSLINTSSSTYIYIAIRRGPMKVPTDATKVFSPQFRLSSTPNFQSGFVTDSNIYQYRPGGASSKSWESRLTDGYKLEPNTNAAEAAGIFGGQWDYMNGIGEGNAASTAVISYMLARAPSFFDEVCHSATSTGQVLINHNLGVAPELVIKKARKATTNWMTWVSPLGAGVVLDGPNTTGAAYTNAGLCNTSPTSTQFQSYEISTGSYIDYVYYLFATCSGVSKCTSFTGTGTLQTIDCGFTSGSRFVLIKRTDSTGDWYVWDSSRGLSSSTDPYLLLNSTAAEVTSTNWVDTTSTGFQVTAASGNNVNINGASYIALAIA